ncbi:alpha/beta hydrolase [Mangrovibacterium diazotrophicum]|uniref:Acetyl esterase/lipase n=1 Tax=Mangrovibacterium diazotrophicum TaxID=1261403 RepID=A0A419VWA5_9BACT|nr:alpha/beta hydrolase [Mangrovibacterium diazotrophicum]RKD86449.1 acetyl esterase/lipase [Mangrovibacterium diazotrophicum]
MKYTIFLFSFLLFIWQNVSAQERYAEQVVDSVMVDTYTYAEKDNQKLDLDIYQPAFDSAVDRPVVLFVHGGGFSGGKRDTPENQKFCKRLAEYGYVAVSVSYRLTRQGTATGFGCDCPADEKLKTFQAAVDDLQDATYFLIERWEQFAIDPHKIILAGSSAGAETVLKAAFQPPYCYGLDSGPVSYAGVISMAGAISDINAIYEESAVPALFFHGTSDNLVPYATAPHHYCSEGSPGYLILYGSYSMAERLRELGKPYWLHTTCGGNHAIAGTPKTEYFDEIIEFCYDFVLKGEKKQIHTIIDGEHKGDYPEYNFCTQEKQESNEE